MTNKQTHIQKQNHKKETYKTDLRFALVVNQVNYSFIQF